MNKKFVIAAIIIAILVYVFIMVRRLRAAASLAGGSVFPNTPEGVIQAMPTFAPVVPVVLPPGVKPPKVEMTELHLILRRADIFQVTGIGTEIKMGINQAINEIRNAKAAGMKVRISLDICHADGDSLAIAERLEEEAGASGRVGKIPCVQA